MEVLLALYVAPQPLEDFILYQASQLLPLGSLFQTTWMSVPLAAIAGE
jgi:hypothetical protein